MNDRYLLYQRAIPTDIFMASNALHHPYEHQNCSLGQHALTKSTAASQSFSRPWKNQKIGGRNETSSKCKSEEPFYYTSLIEFLKVFESKTDRDL